MILGNPCLNLFTPWRAASSACCIGQTYRRLAIALSTKRMSFWSKQTCTLIIQLKLPKLIQLSPRHVAAKDTDLPSMLVDEA